MFLFFIYISQKCIKKKHKKLRGINATTQLNHQNLINENMIHL